jgi:hypothetical protein
MCRWLYGALSDIDTVGPELDHVSSLVPEDHTLSLSVPLTDFHGYELEIPLDDPRFIRDRTHRHVMEFVHDPSGESHFGPDGNPAGLHGQGDLIVPRRLPSAQRNRLRERLRRTAARWHLRRTLSAAPPLGRGPSGHLLHRWMCARQLPIRRGDPGHQGQACLDAGRPTAGVHRAGPRHGRGRGPQPGGPSAEGAQLVRHGVGRLRGDTQEGADPRRLDPPGEAERHVRRIRDITEASFDSIRERVGASSVGASESRPSTPPRRTRSIGRVPNKRPRTPRASGTRPTSGCGSASWWTSTRG